MTTKKVATKVVKKSAPKKSSSVNEAKRVLVCAEGEQCFWVTDGKIISNLVELEQSLASMADEVFKHHVNKERNDFADWIEYVLQDAELAESIRGAQKPNTLRTLVVRRLKTYDV